MLSTHPTHPSSSGSHRLPRALERRPRAFVAEDDDEARRMFELLLRLDGFDVVSARTGGELLDRVSTQLLAPFEIRNAIDLIVTDIHMPGLGGLEVIEGLRAAGWETPVILVTAWADSDTRSSALSLRAALFEKPFDLGDFRTAAWHYARHGRAA